MDSVRFTDWLSEKERRLGKYNRVLAKSDEQEIDLNQVSRDNFAADLKRLIEEQRSPEHKKAVADLSHTLKEICSEYLTATPEQQTDIAGIFTGKQNILSHLTGYPARVSEFIRSADDIHWLEIGLAAALIEDGRTDFRDLWISLGELYLKAELCGIDPAPYFESLSGNTIPGVPPTLNPQAAPSVLREFLQSEYLKSIKNK